MPIACKKDEALYHRKRRLPEVIEATERKLAGLYREARRYGADEILSNKYHVNAAWDREVLVAELEGSRAD